MMSQAQLLQCPDCGHRHDLAALGDVHTFRCDQCGRALKVPQQYRNGSEPPAPALDDTQRQPAVSRIPEPERAAEPVATRPAPAAPATRPRREQRAPRVPIYWRLLVWVLAIPIGLVLVFQVIARNLGWLTQNELIDAFTAGGWDRFRPIAQLLPLAAFVIAAIVQASVYGLECWYRRRARLQAAGAAGTTAQVAGRATGS